MKKKLLFLMMAALTAGTVSCNKNEIPETEGTQAPCGTITVSIGTGEKTKAPVSDMKDTQINTAQLFVFNAANKLETDCYKSGLNTSGNTAITLNTLTGDKTVYALLNHERLFLTQGVTTLSDLENTITDLSQNQADNLVMSGKNTVTVVEFNQNKNASQAPQEVTIFVKRLAARIQLDAVSVDFTGTALEGATFTVKEIYLKNVVGKSPLGVNGLTSTLKSPVTPLALNETDYATAGYWYNKLKKENGAPACIDDVFDQECTVAGASTGIAHVLFAYPNRTVTDSHSDSWGVRCTRLVIRARVTKNAITINKDTFYVLDLPVLAANTIYAIDNVNITMLGKDDDDKDEDIQVGREKFTIKVDEWTGTTHLNYEF